MNIGSVSDWRTAVARESNLHLLEFNDDKYQSGILTEAYEGSGLVDAYTRFDKFLHSAVPSYTCPQRALRSFYQKEIQLVDAGAKDFDDIGAFVGRKTEGVDKFLALKPLKFLEDHMEKFGLEAVSARDIAVEISSAVRSDPDSYTKRPVGNLRASAKRRVDEKLAKMVKDATTHSTHTALMASRSGSALGTTFDPDPPELSNDPIWLTSKQAVLDELGDVPEKTADALIKSAFAAGMKECLGLHNKSENDSDHKRSEALPPRDPSDPDDKGMKEFEAYASFAISFLLEVDLATKEQPRQPCIFSDGYNHLFVTRPVSLDPASIPVDGMAGRTVRLRDKRCAGRRHGAHCACGDVGLPESVLPTAVALKDGAEPAMYSVVFASDLRFEPPDPDMIREKNL